MHKQTRRWMSAFLAALMMCTSVPSAFADESSISLVPKGEVEHSEVDAPVSEKKDGVDGEKSNQPAVEELDASKIVFGAKSEDDKLIIFSSQEDAGKVLEKVEEVFVNDLRFDKRGTDFVVEGNQLTILSNPAKLKKNTIKLIWGTDKESVIIFENEHDDTLLQNSAEKLNLDDGEYELTFEAKDLSDLKVSEYIDVKSKLSVQNKAYTISFLVYKSAAEIEKFVVKDGNEWKEATSKVLAKNDKDVVTLVEYSVSVSDIKEKKTVAIFGENAPFNGKPAEKDNFDSDSYHKSEITFDATANPWAGYENFSTPSGDPGLIQGLIQQGVDTDGDKKISIKELEETKIEVLKLGFQEIKDISLLKHLGPNVKEIYLAENNIEFIGEDVFEKATNLKVIDLGGNKITKIHPNAFRNQNKLERMAISSNPLIEIPDDFLSNFSELKEIFLEELNLESIPSDMFAHNKKLQVVILARNKLQSIPEDLFKNNPEITTLHLSYNRLKELPESISELKELAVLLAATNQLKSIPESYGNLEELSIVNFSENMLETVPEKMLLNMVIRASVDDRVQVSLSMNKIRELPFDTMVEQIDEGIGGQFAAFTINKNFFPTNPDEDLKKKMKRIGVLFEGADTLYYPQKTSMDIQVAAYDEKIVYTQRINSLEMFYWELMNHPMIGQGRMIEDVDQLLHYIDKVDREQLGLKKDVPREEVVAKIFKTRFGALGWEIKTVIEDENGTVVYQDELNSDNNDIEKFVYEYEIKGAKEGQKYTVKRRLAIALGFDEKPVWLETDNEVVFQKTAPPPVDNTKNLKEFAHILNMDKKSHSPINDALEKIIVNKVSSSKARVTLAPTTFKFKPFESENKEYTVDRMAIVTKNKAIYGRTTPGKEGEFIHLIPNDTLNPKNPAKDMELMLKVEIKDKATKEVETKDVVLLLDWNKDFKVDQTNPQKSKLVILNKDKQTNAALVGGKFEISSTNEKKEFTINDASGMNFELEKGDYTIVQLAAPSGYKLDSAPKVVKVEEGKDDTFTFFNEKDSSNSGGGNSGGGNSGGGSGGDGFSGGGGSSNRGSTTIPDNQVPLAKDPKAVQKMIEKAERILKDSKSKEIYSAETLKALEKEIELAKKGDKEAIARLEEALKKADNERISKILGNGFMKGFPNNKFMPNKNMTRAEVAAMFDALIDDAAETSKKFTDIKEDAWYANSLSKLGSLEYIRSDESGKINPQQNITRAEYAYILAKIKNLSSGTKMPKDVNQEHWAAAEIAACVEAGIIAGYKDGSFKPENAITRAEAVAMITRAFNVETKKNREKDYDDVKKEHWAYNAIMTASK